MPAKTNGLSKQLRLNIRVNREQKRILEQAARLQKTSVSDFVLERAVQEAQTVVGEQVVFRLSAAKWKAFIAALDAPPQNLPALRKLLNMPGVFDE